MAASPGGGTATDLTNASPYAGGAAVSIKAVAAAGYQFVNWTAPAGAFANASAAETTFTMPAQDVTVTANFVAVHNLVMAVDPVEGGTATDLTDVSPYAGGVGVSIKAVAAAGYQFVNWTAPAGAFANANAAETTFTMPAQDVTVTANFVAVHNLIMAVDPVEGGTATDLTDVSPYAAGTVISVKAVAAAGYQFVNWTAPAGAFANPNAAETTFTMPDQDVTVTANFGYASMVAAGGAHTVGVKSDGTVATVGLNDEGQLDVGGWTGITQVAAGVFHTVGVKSDGTVVAVGYNYDGQCDVGGWTGITQVAAGHEHTVGLRSDGTVVSVGSNYYGQCDVGGWTGITQVAAGYYHTVGLKTDGTVVVVGDNDEGQCDVGGWTGITQVAAGGAHTVGLNSDGTVVAVGWNEYGQCMVGGWTGITQVAAGGLHTVGLRSNGAVVAVGYNEYGQCDVGGWTGITQVAAGLFHTVGLRSNGAVVAVGWNEAGQCSVGGWMLN